MNFNNCHITFNIKIQFNHSDSNSDSNLDSNLDTNLNINENDTNSDTNLDINENDFNYNSNTNLDINEIDLDTNLDSDLDTNLDTNLDSNLDSNSDINENDLYSNLDINENDLNSNSDINEINLDSNLDINEIDLDSNLDINEIDLDSNLDINEIEFDTNSDINENDMNTNENKNIIKKNRYLITCCCGITYRNVYRDYYNDIYNSDSNLYKNQNERHYKTPIHQLYITKKEIIDKINNTYKINLLNLNLIKLNSFIKTNKDVININTSKKIDDNNFRKYKKLELLNLIIDVFKPDGNEFIINNTNIYKLKIVDLYKLIKDSNIDIKNIKKYKREELINKIIEIYTAPPKEFILFNTNIYNLKIVDLYKFIKDNNIKITRTKSYNKDELINKIIELYSE
jgi:hypothetical protein